MLRDITIGQYFPGHSLIHRLDSRMKILLTIGYIVLLFIVDHPLGYLLSGLLLFFCYLVSSIPVRMIVKSIRRSMASSPSPSISSRSSDCRAMGSVMVPSPIT